MTVQKLLRLKSFLQKESAAIVRQFEARSFLGIFLGKQALV